MDLQWGMLHHLYVFISVLIVIGLCIYGHRKRAVLSRRVMMNPMPSNRPLKSVFLVAALFFACVSLLDPLYDYEWEIIRKKGVNLIIALDSSRSMLASDLKPTRFDRSRLELKSWLDILEGDRIGLVVFSGKARVQCPLTTDYSAFKLILDEMDVGILEDGGTSLYAAVKSALDAFLQSDTGERYLLIVTDGETHDDKLDNAIELAKRHNIKIFTVGLGTREGVPILINSTDHTKEYVKDHEGNIVLTKLDDVSLKRLALETNGAYVSAEDGSFKLSELYRQYIAPEEGMEFEEQKKKKYHHRFYFPLTLALLLLIISTSIPEQRKRG